MNESRLAMETMDLDGGELDDRCHDDDDLDGPFSSQIEMPTSMYC